MMKKIILYTFLFISFLGFSQQYHITGRIVDDNHQSLSGVEIHIGNQVYQSNFDGKYDIVLDSTTEENTISYQLEGYTSFRTSIKNNENQVIDVLLVKEFDSGEVVFIKAKKESTIGSFQLKTDNLQKAPSVTGGIEALLKSNPMVNSNTELSSQYMVRGGSYDENLVYINGIELFRPQLIRSGEQEGMSFLNPSMTESISFTAGGFEAKYGDKMSSVLDLYYKEPKKLEAELEASLLGGSATVGYGSKNGKLSAIAGFRYRDIGLLINTTDADADYNPRYLDFQTNITYRFNQKLKINFLGGFSKNDMDLTPHSRKTTFGSMTNSYELDVFYDGQEENGYNTTFSSASATYKPSSKLTLILDASLHHSVEKEYFDVESSYLLGEIDPTTGGYVQTFDVAGQIDHGRNDLDFLVTNVQHRGQYKIKNGHWDWGLQYQMEDFKDRLDEYHRINNAGYIYPVTDSPGIDYLFDVKNINTQNDLKTNRMSGYVQYSKKHQLEGGKLFYNLGVRATHWDYNGETNVSPRGQIAYKPDWKQDMLFRFSTGLYYQPPFYKEMRTPYGNLNPDIQSQRSLHFILGNDYEFELGKDKERRPFKLTTELYYKKLDDVIPYYIDNVRTVYFGDNLATGNQYGIDMRLNGEFVKGAESWLSFSYAKAQWNINNQGLISMPTDQGFKVGLFYQDYMPAFPSFKVYLTAQFASGLPNGAPIYTNPYNYEGKLNSYKRLDIGFSKIFVDQDENQAKKGTFWANFRELSLGAEIFNLFDIKNNISNLWVQDLSNNQYFAVPNNLTGRFLNVKLNMKF